MIFLFILAQDSRIFKKKIDTKVINLYTYPNFYNIPNKIMAIEIRNSEELEKNFKYL